MKKRGERGRLKTSIKRGTHYRYVELRDVGHKLKNASDGGRGVKAPQKNNGYMNMYVVTDHRYSILRSSVDGANKTFFG